jgi:hypothetical protein
MVLGGQLVSFEVNLIAIDKPTDRKRWNGDPMHSEAASDALNKAVNAFQDVIRAEGFDVVNTGYGARWMAGASEGPR